MSTKTKRFPISLQIRKHLKIEVDVLKAADIKDLMNLYAALEDDAISRIPWNVNSPNHPKLVKRLMEDDRAHFMSARHKGEMIGSISLHHNPALWTRHIGSVVFVSHPDYRRYGIASTLFEEIIPLAQSLDIEKLYAQLTKENVQGIRMLKHFGFTREATFKDHIKDPYGRYLDMRVYSLDLEGAHKAMADLIADFSDYSG
jgi:RimJ/RimL family protein N-acetyltransferase